jgi:hypothetical protein
MFAYYALNYKVLAGNEHPESASYRQGCRLQLFQAERKNCSFLDSFKFTIPLLS